MSYRRNLDAGDGDPHVIPPRLARCRSFGGPGTLIGQVRGAGTSFGVPLIDPDIAQTRKEGHARKQIPLIVKPALTAGPY